MKNVKPLIIAHRGESFDAPENTLAAINLAWERKAKAVEIDIQITKDKEIVVIHDYDTKRISGIKKTIKNSTYKELRALDFGSFKNEKWKNERIPLLSEVLKTFPDGAKLIIEIKSDHSIIEKLKYELANAKIAVTQIEIIAFNLNVLSKAKQFMPEYKMLYLVDLDYFWPYWMLWINKKRIINKVKRNKLDGVNVWSGKILTKKFIETFHKEGLLVYCWTVNDSLQAKYLVESNIDGITSDRAEWLSLQLKNLE